MDHEVSCALLICILTHARIHSKLAQVLFIVKQYWYATIH